MIDSNTPYHVVQIIHDTWPQLFRNKMTGKLDPEEKVLEGLYDTEEQDERLLLRLQSQTREDS